MSFHVFVLTKPVFYRFLLLFLMTLLNPLVTTGQETNETPERSSFKLKIELAKTNLHLAEVELQLAEIQNAKTEAKLTPLVTGDRREKELRFRQISTSNIARLKSNVEIARAQLSEAVNPSSGSSEKIRQHYANEKKRLAKLRLELKKHQKADGLKMEDLEITRLELQYRIAQLKLELLGSPENLLNVIDSLQRQLDQVNEELITHDQRLSAVEQAGNR